jgi:hypothetical protein
VRLTTTGTVTGHIRNSSGQLASFCLETHPVLYLQGFGEHIGDWN